MSRQREYDQRGYTQQANRGAYSNSERQSRGQSYSRPLYDQQNDMQRYDQWRSNQGQGEQRNDQRRDSSVANRQRAYADRWADDWRAQSDDERYSQNYGRDDYGNDYDELPDGGRGVYTHEAHDYYGQGYGNDVGARTREHDREFIEAVYGPHREKIMPRSYQGHHHIDNQGGWGYGRAHTSSSEGAPYMQHQAERQPGYGRSEIIGNNWSQTRAGGDWNHQDMDSQHWNTQYDAERYGQQGVSPYQAPYQSNLQSAGNYRGKGPKGYERSDERLKELVCERLTDAPSIDASEITVEVKNREVTLTGTVTSRSAKHLAEDLVESVGGIRDINNQLKISTNDSTQRYRETMNSGAQFNAQPSVRSIGQANAAANTPQGMQTTRDKGQDPTAGKSTTNM